MVYSEIKYLGEIKPLKEIKSLNEIEFLNEIEKKLIPLIDDINKNNKVTIDIADIAKIININKSYKNRIYKDVNYIMQKHKIIVDIELSCGKFNSGKLIFKSIINNSIIDEIDDIDYTKIIKSIINEIKNNDKNIAIVSVNNMRKVLKISMRGEYFIREKLEYMLRDYDNIYIDTDNYKIGGRVFIFRYKKKDNNIIDINNNGICSICNEFKYGSYHHIIPRSINGNSLDTNLIFLCNKCHDNVEILCSNCKYQIEKICNIEKFVKCWKNSRLYFKKI